MIRYIHSLLQYFREQLEEARREKESLEDRLQALEEKNKDEYDFRTNANGRPYSDAFRICVWKLLALNLGEVI